MRFDWSSRIRGRAALVMAVALAAGGCSQHLIGAPSISTIDDYDKSLRQVAKDLEPIAAHADEFGSVTASAPAILRNPGELFAFDLAITAKDLFERNRLEVATSTRHLFDHQTRLTAQVQFPEVAPAEAVETLPLLGVPALPDAPGGANPIGAQGFTPGLSIASPDGLGLNVRDLIKLTADDHATLKVLEWSSAPSFDSSNKLVFAAILNVSVRPGWRTYEGYTAQITIRPSYDRSGRSPLALVGFPGVDAQVVDQRDSLRRQLALALAIEAQGPEFGAALDSETVDRLERDLASVTTLNSVVGFNEAGLTFGWQVSPRVAANLNSDGDAQAARHLQKQSFPALVFLMLDKYDLPKSMGGGCAESGPRDARCPKRLPTSIEFDYSIDWRRAPAIAEDESIIPFAAAFSRTQHPRRKEQRHLDQTIRMANSYVRLAAMDQFVENVAAKDAAELAADAADVAGPIALATANATVAAMKKAKIEVSPDGKEASDAVALAARRKQVADAVALAVSRAVEGIFEERRRDGYGYPVMELRERADLLYAETLHSGITQELPTPISVNQPPVSISNVAPRQGWTDRSSWFAISGRGFLPKGEDSQLCAETTKDAKEKAKRPRVFVGGIEARVDLCTDRLLVFAVEQGFKDGGRGLVDVAVKSAGGLATRAGAIDFSLKAPTAPPSVDSAVQIAWQATPSGRPVIQAISATGSATAVDILSALERSECCGVASREQDVDLNIDLRATTEPSK